MKTVGLGHSSVEVITVCMGTDLIGSRIERDAAFELLDLFRESGGTFIDAGNFSVPAQYAGPDACERFGVLRAVAAELAATLNQVVIAWMSHSDPPVLPIVAGSRPAQLAENLAALEIRLSEDQMRRLDEAGNPDIKQAWLR